jgi:uncharacterized protein
MSVEIKSIHQPSAAQLEQLNVANWPIWMKEVATFTAVYEEDELFYILDGEVQITQDGKEPVRFAEGDFVMLPVGLSCRWDVLRDVRKHFSYPLLVEQPTQEHLAQLGILNCPTWTAAVSEFSQTYEAKKICYFVEGEVLVRHGLGEETLIRAGDLVTFAIGMTCTWMVKRPVKVHYCYPEQFL